jgi:hypothetical protein
MYRTQCWLRFRRVLNEIKAASWPEGKRSTFSAGINPRINILFENIGARSPAGMVL